MDALNQSSPWCNRYSVSSLGLYATQQITQQQTQLGASQHQLDLQIAKDQQQATVLQTYIDNIQDLLLNHHLLQSTPGDDVAVLARARTLAALQGLDGERKGRLLSFIKEAKLIGFVGSNGKASDPIIDLSGADLIGANMNKANLTGAFLNRANLSGARFFTQKQLDEVSSCGSTILPEGLTCHHNQ